MMIAPPVYHGCMCLQKNNGAGCEENSVPGSNVRSSSSRRSNNNVAGSAGVRRRGRGRQRRLPPPKWMSKESEESDSEDDGDFLDYELPMLSAKSAGDGGEEDGAGAGAAAGADESAGNALASKSGGDDGLGADDLMKSQPWYFHVVASAILVVHGFTFLVPQDLGYEQGGAEDTDMLRTLAKWAGYDLEWTKFMTPYAQGLASVFNISLGLVSWWTSRDSERFGRLIQLRVFAFCINILHAYITGPIVYQNEDVAVMGPGNLNRIIGLFRLSYLTPGLMAAGVTEVGVDKRLSPEEAAEENGKANGTKSSQPTSSASKKQK